jgi:thymidylate kinase
MIIVNIDGPNGVGKSTVTNLVMNHYNLNENVKTDFIHFHRREFPVGQLIQRVLNGEVKMDPMVLQMLYSADRLDFTKTQLSEIRKSGTEVLLVDRYYTTGIVHGALDGITLNTIKVFDIRSANPNIHIILTAPYEVLVTRLKSQKLNKGETGDIFEAPENLSRICDGYKLLHIQIPYVGYVNANRPIQEVVNDIIDIINEVREDEFGVCSLD